MIVRCSYAFYVDPLPLYNVGLYKIHLLSGGGIEVGGVNLLSYEYRYDVLLLRSTLYIDIEIVYIEDCMLDIGIDFVALGGNLLYIKCNDVPPSLRRIL